MTKYHEPTISHVSHVLFNTLMLDKLMDFYQQVIGLKVLNHDAHHVQLSADGSMPLITLVYRREYISKPKGRTGLYHIALLMPDRKQLGLFLEHLQAVSYPLMGASHHGVSEALYLEDPEGNGIEVYADTPDKTWERHQDRPERLDMITRRLDLDSLMKAAQGETWSSAPKDMVMGHIHLHVADLNKSQVFYKALGFDMVQTIPGQATFVSAGGYHHHIGFNVWNGIGAPPPPENAAGMAFFTLLFPDEETLENAVKRAASLGHDAHEDNTGIYLRDPSMNLIQCRVAAR